MTITGGNLSNATAVAFGSLQATIVSETDNQIVVDVPPASAAMGLVDVTVTTPAGTTETTPDDQVSYVSAPAVSDISVSSGDRSGGDLASAITATADDATAVDFGQDPGEIVYESDSSIDVYSPTSTVSSTDITVVTPGGTSATTPQDLFTYVQPAPTLAGLSQSSGPAAGGTDHDHRHRSRWR